MAGQMGLSPAERQWLRSLAEGATVVEVAAASGYSARHMRRLLADVYRRLGVTGRVPALVAAAKLGLLDDDRPPSAASTPGPGPVDESLVARLPETMRNLGRAENRGTARDVHR